MIDQEEADGLIDTVLEHLMFGIMVVGEEARIFRNSDLDAEGTDQNGEPTSLLSEMLLKAMEHDSKFSKAVLMAMKKYNKTVKGVINGQTKGICS